MKTRFRCGVGGLGVGVGVKGGGEPQQGQEGGLQVRQKQQSGNTAVSVTLAPGQPQGDCPTPMPADTKLGNPTVNDENFGSAMPEE